MSVTGEEFRSVIGERLSGDGELCRWQGPVLGQEIRFRGAGAPGVDRAVTLAAKAQKDWAETPPFGRRLALMDLAARIEAAASEIGMLDCIDMGKPISMATQEAHIAAFILRYYAEAMDKTGGFVAPSAPQALAYSEPRAYGVVGAIVSWNYPAINAAMKFAPALAAGNAILLKPSTDAPRSALRIAELALETALPKGLLTVLAGGPETGTALCRHPGVAMLAFTGSTEVGRQVAGMAAEGLKPAIIEAGGKNPILVCDDVTDLEGLARDALAEAYANSGQLCVARSKILIPRALVQRLTEALVEAARALEPGEACAPSTAFGPLSSVRHARRVLAGIAEALASGASLLRDGRGPEHLMQGMTLLASDEATSPIFREEYFGPVLGIGSYDRLEEGIALANAGGYGLAATAWTTDLSRARALSRSLFAGHIKIKAKAGIDAGTGMALPVEPAGLSGYGTEFGTAALNSYSRRQAVEYHGLGF